MDTAPKGLAIAFRQRLRLSAGCNGSSTPSFALHTGSQCKNRPRAATMCSTAGSATCHGVVVASTGERPSSQAKTPAYPARTPDEALRESRERAPSAIGAKPHGRPVQSGRPIRKPRSKAMPGNHPVPAWLSTRDSAPMPKRWHVERTRRNPAAGSFGLPPAGSQEPASRRLPARVCLHLSLEPADTGRNHENEDKVFKNKNRVDFQWPVLRNDQLVGLSREFLHSDYRDQ